MSVIGTLLVPFGESAVGAGGGIIAEWDDTMNVAFAGKVLNSYLSRGQRYFVVRDGNTVRVMTATDIKSQFIPGEQAYLLVHAPGVEIVAVKATHGTIVGMGEETLARSDELGFPLVGDPQSLQYLPAVPVTAGDFGWFGNTGRDITVAGREVRVNGGSLPCVASVSYQVRFSRYMLQTPTLSLAEDATHPILVYIYYKEPDA